MRERMTLDLSSVVSGQTQHSEASGKAAASRDAEIDAKVKQLQVKETVAATT